ncbi:MAG: sensor domain-containing diguanylate cyclase [Pseudomonadota bacterium]
MIIEQHPLFESPFIKSFLNAFEYSMVSVLITDTQASYPRYRFLYVNQAFKDQTGYQEEDLFHKSPKILQGEKTDSKTIKKLDVNLAQNEIFIGQTVNYRKNGSEYIVRWCINPLQDQSNKIIAYISFQIEMTEYVQTKDEAFFLAEALNQSSGAAQITDLQGKILYANNAFSEMTGYTLEEIKGRNPRMLSSGNMDDVFYKRMWETLMRNQPFNGVFINRHKNGHEYFQEQTISPIMDENQRPMFFLAISKDNSADVQKTSILEFKAYHDPLTRLFNRTKFNEVMIAKQRDFKENHIVYSVILGDIDNFKPLNDYHGHDIGDIALFNVAQCLKKNLRKQDQIFRWGGEEFIVVVDVSLQDSLIVAENLRKAVDELSIEGHPELKLAMSFGVTQFQLNDSQETLFKRVDEALYLAKSKGKNQVVSKTEN